MHHLGTLNYYRRVSGSVREKNGRLIWWDCFPGLMKLCVQREGEIGQTFNFPPVFFDSSEKELSPKVAAFIKERGILLE